MKGQRCCDRKEEEANQGLMWASFIIYIIILISLQV